MKATFKNMELAALYLETDDEDYILELLSNPPEDFLEWVKKIQIEEEKTMLTIKKCDNKLALYCKFDGQTNPQPAYIFLDPERKTVEADFSGEIGNAQPMDVWHNRRLRFPLPSNVSGDAANRIMADLLPTFERITAGYTCEWDGNNMIGKYTPDALDAIDDVWPHIDYTVGSADLLAVWQASDWLQYDSDEGLGLKADMSDEEIDAVIESLEKDAESDGIDLVEGLRAEVEARVSNLNA